MNYVNLIIGDPAIAELDLDSTFDIALQYSIADIKDISKRNSSYSKTIILPGTKNNNYWLGNLFDVNSDFSGFNPNKKTAARLLVNTETVINGFLQLKKIKKLMNVDRQGNNIQYEVVLNDNAVDLMTELGERTLAELNLDKYEHEYTRTNIVNSWNNTWEDGYVYPMYGNRDRPNIYKVEEFHPSLFYKSVLDQIITGAGYGWTGSFKTNPVFEKEVIAYMGDSKPKIATSEIDRRKFRAGIVNRAPLTGFIPGIRGPFTVLNNIMPFNNDSTAPNFDNANTYNPTTFEWISDRSGNFIIEYSVDYLFKVTNGSFWPNVLVNVGYFRFTHTVEYFINGQWVLWPDSELLIVPNHFNYGSFPVGGININVGGTKVTSSLNIAQGTKVRMRLKVVMPDAGFIDGNGNQTYGFEDFLQMNYSIIWPTNSPNNFFRNRPERGTVVQGDTISLGSVLSEKIKQKDLISDLIKRYNLYIQVDADNPKLLVFDSRYDFYEDGPILDWTDKKDYSSEDNIELLSELQFKNMLFTYKEDSDVDNDFYKSLYGEVYGQYKWTFDNDFVKGEQKIESPFSPTPLTNTTFNAIVPSIDPANPKGNNRVLLWGGMKPCSTWTFNQTVFGSGTVSVSGITFSNYPYAGHLDDPINPSEDINFGSFRRAMHSGLNTMTNNNLFNKYWRSYVQQISNGRLVTSKFNLTEADIRFIKNNFNSKIFVLDSYYYINKIKDYKPMSNGVTEVELLKIEDGIKWSDTINTEDFSTAPISYVGRGININGTNTDGGTRGLVVGYDNVGGGVYIKPDGEMGLNNQLIVGSKNEVLGDVTVIGDYNIVKDKSYVFGDRNTLLGDKSFVYRGYDNVLNESGGVMFSDYNVINAKKSLVIGGGANKVNVDNNLLLHSYSLTTVVPDSVYLGDKMRVGIFDGRVDIKDIKFEETTKIFNGKLNSLDDVIGANYDRDGLIWDNENEIWVPGKRQYINFFDFTSLSTTTFSAANVWTPLVMVAQAGFSNSKFSLDTNGELVWGGPIGPQGKITLSTLGPIVVKLEVILNGYSGNNEEIHVAFFKNGVLWPCSEQSVVTTSGGKANSLSAQCLVEVVAGDSLRVYMKNSTNNQSFVLRNVNVVITEY